MKERTMQTAIQTQFVTVSNKLTLVSKEQYEDTLSTDYKCNVKVKLAGDSIWDCKVKTVTITGICITETQWEDGEDVTTHIAVTHTGGEGSWRLYTDTEFEATVSALLLTDVSYTEQGMQDDGYASMEL